MAVVALLTNHCCTKAEILTRIIQTSGYYAMLASTHIMRSCRANHVSAQCSRLDAFDKMQARLRYCIPQSRHTASQARTRQSHLPYRQAERCTYLSALSPRATQASRREAFSHSFMKLPAGLRTTTIYELAMALPRSGVWLASHDGS